MLGTLILAWNWRSSLNSKKPSKVLTIPSIPRFRCTNLMMALLLSLLLMAAMPTTTSRNTHVYRPIIFIGQDHSTCEPCATVPCALCLHSSVLAHSRLIQVDFPAAYPESLSSLADDDVMPTLAADDADLHHSCVVGKISSTLKPSLNFAFLLEGPAVRRVSTSLEARGSPSAAACYLLGHG